MNGPDFYEESPREADEALEYAIDAMASANDNEDCQDYD